MKFCCDAESEKQMDQYWKEQEKNQKADIEENDDNIENEKEDIIPYKFKYLLTKSEWSFYKKLKEVTDKRNLHILAKVRLADLVEVEKWVSEGGFKKYFSKIKSKHVDFVLCNPDNLAVKAIIELEDGTHHNSPERARRDDFVDKVLKKCGYPVIYTYGGANLDEIFDKLNIK